MKQFLTYAIRWQLSTPILYLALATIPHMGTLEKTIIANLIGAVCFYPVDTLIFKKGGKK